jgi:hypothetical protein
MKEITKDYYSYGDLVDSMDVAVLLEGHDNDYQGDSFYLLKKGRQYGILVFGWGSCSGCDALEASYGDVGEITKLRDSLWESITWMGKVDMRKYVKDKDFKLEYYGHTGAGREFEVGLKEYFGV